VHGEKVARLAFFHHPIRAGDDNERASVAHRHLDRNPGAAAIRAVGADELRVFAVAVVHRAAHREGPQHFLTGDFVENRIGVGELQRALALEVIENENGIAPRRAVVGGDARHDVAHVGLAGNLHAEGGDELTSFPLREVGFPSSDEPGC